MDGSNLYTVADYTSDALGRTTALSEGGYSRSATYNAKSQLTQDVVTTLRSDGTYVATTSYYYNASETASGSGLWDGVTSGGSYMGGAVTRTATVNTKDGTDSAAADTSMVYRLSWRDGTVTAKSTYDGDTGSSSNTLWTSDYYYDATGTITSVHIQDGHSRTVSFVTDGGGLILQRDEADTNTSTGDPRELHYYFNGIRVGAITNNGTSDLDYVEYNKTLTATPAYGPFRGGASYGAPFADFDQSYSPINGLSVASASAQYTAQAGDTLASIALQMWGDASLWYLIADANGLTGTETLTPGIALTIPNKVANAHNNSTTFRPYDPNDAIGDISPTRAKMPKNSCGVMGQILAAIVAVAVAAVVGSIPVVGPILAPYAANAAQQGVLIATGNQDKFDWKSLGRVAVQQALFGFPTNPIGAMVANAGTQFVSTKLGLQDKFHWGDVATAGITALATRGLNSIMPPGTSPTLQRIAVNSASLIASSAATSLASGRDFGDTLIAGLPSAIGQTIGQMATDAISSRAFGGDDPAAQTADKMLGLGNKIDSSVARSLPSGYRIASLGRPLDLPPALEQYYQRQALLDAGFRPLESADNYTFVKKPTASQGPRSSGDKPDSAGDSKYGWIVPGDGPPQIDLIMSAGQDGSFSYQELAPGLAQFNRASYAEQGLGDFAKNTSAYAQALFTSAKDRYLDVEALIGQVEHLASVKDPNGSEWATVASNLRGLQTDYIKANPGETLLWSGGRFGFGFLKATVGAPAGFFLDGTLGTANDVFGTNIGDYTASHIYNPILAAGKYYDEAAFGSRDVLADISWTGGKAWENGVATWDNMSSTWNRGGLLAFASRYSIAGGEIAGAFAGPAILNGFSRAGLAGDLAAEGAPLLSSASGDLAGVERASQPLLDAVRGKRAVTWATPGSDAERFLNMRGAEAAAFGPEDILLRPDPSKAAVLEEFLHGTQQRLGVVDRLGTSGLGSAETHVKDFMIRHQNMLGLSAEDVRRIQVLRDMGL